jgi:hypothetical protein
MKDHIISCNGRSTKVVHPTPQILFCRFSGHELNKQNRDSSLCAANFSQKKNIIKLPVKLFKQK